MSDLIQDCVTAVGTVPSGAVSTYPDIANKRMRINDGTVDRYLAPLTNISSAAQTFTASTRTYVAGSTIIMPANGLAVGTTFRWTIPVTKTAAGVASSVIDICIGTAGTTADPAILSFTKPAGTAVADEGKIVIEASVRAIGASAVMVGEFTLVHNGNLTGHLTTPMSVINTVSAAFNSTTSGLIVGVCMTTGAADAITSQFRITEAYGL